MGKWKRGWKQRIESYWFWFQFFLFSFSVLVTSHKKWIIWQHFFTKRKGMWRNAAICGELENLYFNLKRNEKHFAFHDACKQTLLLGSRVQGLNGSHMSIKQFQPRGNWMTVLATLECNPLPFLLGKPQRGLAPNFQAGSLVWVWGQFWLGPSQHKPIKPYSSHLATHTIEASSYSVLMTNISHSPVEWCGICWIVIPKTLEYNHPFLPFFQLLSSPTTEE